MEKSEAYYLGRIVRSQGTNGELVIFLDIVNPSGYAELEFIFIEIEKRLIPFHLDTICIKEAYAIVALEDINTPEQARELVGKNIYLPLTDMPDLKHDQFLSCEIIGFTVIDKEKGEIGRVKHSFTDQLW